MSMKLIILSLSLKLLLVYSHPCDERKTCGECIRDFNDCKWCSMDNFSGDHRCSAFNDTAVSCDVTFTEYPISSQVISRNDSFSSALNKEVQITPQAYKIKLRPGKSVDFQFSFKGVADYPVDLYFLIDASGSMDAVKAAIANSSSRIYEEMKSKTKNVMLGIGTFRDKNAVPFIADFSEAASYSYRNELKLTTSLQEFQKTIEKEYASIDGKSDNPESGLEALSQVIVCEKEIGWRTKSRKIVVFFTDATSHSAGDGKWAGLVQPYDGQCYTENGTYTKELEMDYPSIGIINKMASEKEVVVVFIVESKVQYIYEKSLKLKGSKVIGYDSVIVNDNTVLKFDNNDLEKTLAKIYQEITQSLKLKVNMASEDKKHIKLSFTPDYYTDHGVANLSGTEFQGKVHLSEYYGKDNIAIDVSIEGISESLRLSVDVIKDCDCETNARKIVNDAEYCSNGGALICGICECNKHRYGATCDCVSKGIVPGDPRCMGAGSDQLCSGRGVCDCGVCTACQQGFVGKFCECDTTNCPKQCGGRGSCACGEGCRCEPGWTGAACECSLLPCDVVDGKMCNNRGKCTCNECKCDDIATSWDARYQQNLTSCQVLPCPECHARQCRLLHNCAICHHQQTPDCLSACDRAITVTAVATLSNTERAFLCDNVKVDVTCDTKYFYRYKDEFYGIQLYVETVRNCMEKYYMLGGIFLATLILLGVGTVVAWKLLTDARDRREYERFVKAHQADCAAACINPVYTPASTTINNPTFRKQSVDFR